MSRVVIGWAAVVLAVAIRHVGADGFEPLLPPAPRPPAKQQAKPVAAENEMVSDERLLRQHGINADGQALLDYLRQHSPTQANARRITRWIDQLGSDQFVERQAASVALRKMGMQVAVALQEAARSTDLETADRARRCLAALQGQLALSGAVVRLLGQRAPAGAVATLLDYLPAAELEGCAHEVEETLLQLAARPGKTDPALLAALTDRLPLRRGMAAFVLGRSRDRAEQEAVRRLLHDKDLTARYRAIQGLLAGKHRDAVPALLGLIEEAPREMLDEVLDTLQALAGDQAPSLPVTGNNEVDRKRLRAAWSKWWDSDGRKVDLARLGVHQSLLGYTLIPEMHANKVWECGRDGKPLWEITGLQCPIDAQVLSGGRILVAELNGNRVTERDRQGKVLWQMHVQTPIACQRLANGHTFIATNQGYLIANKDGTAVLSYQAEGGFFIHSIQIQRNGHVVCVSMEGVVRELDANARVLRNIPLSIQGGWSGIESAPGNHYLVVNNNAGRIQEVNTAGKVVWSHDLTGACYASRLPGGNTLIVSNNTGAVEVSPTGKTVWKCPITTSLWRAHRR
jgi:hypothetical protein